MEDSHNITLTTEVNDFCETLEDTDFDWVTVCVQMAMTISYRWGSSSPLIMIFLKNLKYIQTVSKVRGQSVQNLQDFEDVSTLFGFQVGYCASVFKGKNAIVNCSNILYDFKVTDMSELTTFCEEHDEFHSKPMCGDIIRLQSVLFNITNFFASNEELIFYSYFYPIVTLLVLLSNVLLVMTFLRGRFLSAAHLLLMVIALMDTLTVVLPTPYLFYYLTLGNYLSYISYHNCVAITAITMYVSPICHGISIWLNFGLAMQRYVLLWNRSYADSSLLQRRVCVLFMLVVLLVVSGIFSPGLLTLTDFPEVYVYSSNNEEIRTTLQLPMTDKTSQLQFAQMYFARGLIIQVIPCLGMLLLFVELALKWKAAVKANRIMTTNERGSGDLETTQTFNKVVLYMVTMSLIAEVPVAVVTFSTTWAMMVNEAVSENMRVIGFITNIIIILTPSFNLLVYAYHGDWFRHNLKQLLSCGCKPRQENRSEDSTVVIEG